MRRLIGIHESFPRSHGNSPDSFFAENLANAIDRIRLSARSDRARAAQDVCLVSDEIYNGNA